MTTMNGWSAGRRSRGGEVLIDPRELGRRLGRWSATSPISWSSIIVKCTLPTSNEAYVSA